MSTLTIRAIEDDCFFLSFNPNGESWSSLRPDFQVSTPVYGGQPVGQNTVFLTPFDEKKKWDVGLFNPPQYVFYNQSSIVYSSGGQTKTVNIPLGYAYSESSLANLLTIASPFTVTVTYNPGTMKFTFTSVLNVSVQLNGLLSCYLRLPYNFNIPAAPVVSGVTSAEDFFQPPDVVNSIGIKSKKWFKGQYYITLEDCNIRVKNNYSTMELNQPIYKNTFSTPQTVEFDINGVVQTVTIPSGSYNDEEIAGKFNQLALSAGPNISNVQLLYNSDSNVFTFVNNNFFAGSATLSSPLNTKIGFATNIVVPAATLGSVVSATSGPSYFNITQTTSATSFAFSTGYYSAADISASVNSELQTYGPSLSGISLSFASNQFTFTNTSSTAFATVSLSGPLANSMGFGENFIIPGSIYQGSTLTSTSLTIPVPYTGNAEYSLIMGGNNAGVVFSANGLTPVQLVNAMNSQMDTLDTPFKNVRFSYDSLTCQFVVINNNSCSSAQMFFSLELAAYMGFPVTFTVYKFPYYGKSMCEFMDISINGVNQRITIPVANYTQASLIALINTQLNALGGSFANVTLSYELGPNLNQFTNAPANLGLPANIQMSINVANFLGFPTSFILPAGIIQGNVLNPQMAVTISGNTRTILYPVGFSYNASQLATVTTTALDSFGLPFSNVDLLFIPNQYVFGNLNIDHVISVSMTNDIASNLYFPPQIQIPAAQSGVLVGQAVNAVYGTSSKPLVFEDTCIFAEVEILNPSEQGNLELQNFNQGVTVTVYATGESQNYSYTPFDNRKILFPIMMRRDIPPFNGVAINPSPTGVPNARTTGFHTEHRSKLVHIIQLNANEEIKLSFRRSNGEKLPMATDWTYINPNSFETVEEYEEFYNSRKRGWFISQASTLIRLTNARPEFL